MAKQGRQKKGTKQAAPTTPWGRFWAWRKHRRLRDDAKALIKESRRALRKHGHRVKDEVAQQVREATDDLVSKRKQGSPGELRDAVAKQEKLLNEHLAFARKPAYLEYAEGIGVAVLIALLLRAFVVEAFKIPSGSMIPTLKVGDYLFVNKFVYGLRIPWTEIKFFTRPPGRGEVVVFRYPKQQDKDFIKRVIGIGGDWVEVRDNQIYLNKKPISRKRLPGDCTFADAVEDSPDWEVRPCNAYEEDLGGYQYRVYQDPYGGGGDYPQTRVPPGHAFVMGDNRDNSSDSRKWGFVKYENIKGKAMFIWYSRGHPQGMRWDRLFDSVHTLDRDEPLVEAPLPQLPTEY